MPRATESSVTPTEAGFQKVYVVLKIPECGSKGEMTEIDSVYISEDQAYAEAIRKQIAELDEMWGIYGGTKTEHVSELCTLVTENGASFKDKFESMAKWMEEFEGFQDCDEYMSYRVKSCRVERFEKVYLDDFLDYSEEDEDDEDEEDEDETDKDDTDDDGASTKNGNGTASGKKRRRD